MSALIVVLLILALLFGGVGLFVKGLVWLIVIAAVMLVVDVVLLGRRR